MIKVELFWSLDAVERDAAGALDRERQPCLFDRLSWYRLLERHCPPPGKLLVARAEDGDGNRSWLFLSVQGRRAAAYANWYTLRFGALHDIVGDAGSWALDLAIADALKRQGLVSVELYPLNVPDAHRLAFATAGWRGFSKATGVNWQADVAGLSFNDYWARRPAKLRNTAARRARASALECNIYNEFEPVAWSDYEAVYQASWKPHEGSRAFLRALAEQEGAAGTLRLGIARLAGAPVAAQFWLVENGRATIHKLAHVESAKALSPGTVLSAAMFRNAIDVDRVGVIDFGLGDEPYKADWMDRRETVGRVRAFNPRTIAGMAGAARALVARLRND